MIARFFMQAKPSTLATDILAVKSATHDEKNTCINHWPPPLHR
jgi:hypothetical protein